MTGDQGGCSGAVVIRLPTTCNTEGHEEREMNTGASIEPPRYAEGVPPLSVPPAISSARGKIRSHAFLFFLERKHNGNIHAW